MEVFSTNFTEKGLTLLKQMSKKDIADLIGITGEKYFNFIKYEF
jgi:hypothetical protein